MSSAPAKIPPAGMPAVRERVVVGTPVEGDGLIGQALAVPEVLEHLLDGPRAVRSGEALLVAVAVVDEPRVVRGGQHVEVEHDRDVLDLLLVSCET